MNVSQDPNELHRTSYSGSKRQIPSGASIDLQQPLRLRFIDSQRSALESIAVEGMDEEGGLLTCETNEVSGIRGDTAGRSAAIRSSSSPGQSNLRSQSFTFGCGVAAAILFWLYALPALREHYEPVQPGRFETNEAGTTPALTNAYAELPNRKFGIEAISGHEHKRPMDEVSTPRLISASKRKTSTASVSDGSAQMRTPRVFAMADNPMHLSEDVESPRVAGKAAMDVGPVGSGVLATQLGSLNPVIRTQAAQTLLERGWQADHVEMARRFLRAPLSMQTEMVDSLGSRDDINVVPWFLWMLEVAEPQLAVNLLTRLEESASARDASAIRAACANEDCRFGLQLSSLADRLDQRSY